MGQVHPISLTIVLGAVLCGCAHHPTPPPEAADPCATAAATTGEAPAAEATAAANPPAARSLIDFGATCPLEVERQIACVQEYLPMIVDTRIRLDFPAGMAERGKDEAGRAELLAIAMQEFPEHYSEDKIPMICQQRQAMAQQMPPEVLADLMALGPSCHTEQDCAGFTRCVAPMVERIFTMRASAGAR